MKYILVLVTGVVMFITTFYTHKNSNRLQILNDVLNVADDSEAITHEGQKSIDDAYSCLGTNTFDFFHIYEEKPNGNKKFIKQLTLLLHTFPVHLLATRERGQNIELDALFNGAKPVVVSFILIKDSGTYKLSGVNNLCEVFDRVNLYYENAEKIKNEKN